MSVGQYQVWLSTDKGVRIALLDDYSRLDYTQIEHGVGSLELDIKSKTFDWSLVHEDYKVEVWRRPPAAAGYLLENVYLITGWRRGVDQNGTKYYTLRGVDGNHIIKRRGILYGASEDTTNSREYAEKKAKILVRYALVSGYASSSRAISSTYFIVAANASPSQGAYFKKNYTYRRLMDALTALCETSTGRNVPIYWRVAPVSGVQYKFDIYPNQLGSDRRASIILSVESNNLREPVEDYDATDELNAVTCLGDNFESTTKPSLRYNTTRVDVPRYNISVYGRKEGFCTASGSDNTDLGDAASDYLSKNTPKHTFTGQVSDNEGQRYGIDWFFGDRVTAKFGDDTFDDARISTVHVTVEETESIETTLSIPTESIITSG